MPTRPTVLPDWATNSTYGAGSRPWNSQVNKTQPSSGIRAEGFDPENPLYADYLNWVLNNHSLWLDYHDGLMAGPIFGDGSDGAVTMDGVNVFSFATLTGTVYTLNRDLMADTLTVTGSGVVLDPNGYRIYCRTSLTTASGGSISADGLPQSSASIPTGTILGGGTGGISSAIATDGGPGGATSNTLGGIAGAGGNSAGSANVGGAAGNAAPLAAASGYPHSYSAASFGHVCGISGGVSTWSALQGGAGGGGGAGVLSHSGGHGGQGGRVIAIAARQISLANATDIHANGGNGGGALGGAGGGGGGGGGAILLMYLYCNQVLGGSQNCVHGSGGVATGGGANGTNGADGAVIDMGIASVSQLPFPTAHKEDGFIQLTSATTATVSFGSAFSAAPPTAGGYKFDVTLARTDAGGGVDVWVTNLTTGGFTINFSAAVTGVVSWSAWVD